MKIRSVQMGKCMACSKQLENEPYEIDHVKPLADGGDNDMKNL